MRPDRLAPEDRRSLASKPVAEGLLALLVEATVVGNTELTRLVPRDEAPPDLDAAIAAAARRVAEAPMAIDIMRVTNDCRLFFLRGVDADEGDEDDTIAARILDLPTTRAHIERALARNADALRAVRGGDAHGAIVGVPREGLLCAFFIEGGDLFTGVHNVALNVKENFDDDDDVLSPHVYWVHGGGIDRIEYTLDDDGDLVEIALPEALADRWRD